MRKALLSVGVGLAFFATFATSGTAQAAGASGTITCKATGVYGELDYSNWKSSAAGSSIDLGLYAYDTLADGHHVKIRFVSEALSGNKTYWPWRSWYGGKDTGRAWYTYASNGANGLYAISLEVARFEGSTKLNSNLCG
ncbi:hypothetical protein PUR57_30670 [Streptomyces sp. JV176]|uniref:hypothetical protein n=1 Tax=Streptomyces sp. JV176 TaxID=858630 RepID=UPI002E79C0BE|nr:hypothetical protein [Streptomyces sp. JV176]MEE1802980.1 hypothetical protein [Streptomyces sp. JV176]